MHATTPRRWYDRLPPPLRGRPLTLARRALAAALLVVAAVLALQPGAEGGEPTAPMLVTAHDLPLGATLGRDDVRMTRVPESSRPTGALTEPAAADGRVLAGRARAGEPLTDVRLVGPRSVPAGTATVPVRLADPGVADLLRPGSRVDVVTLAESGEPGGGHVLAGGVSVLTVVDEGGDGERSVAPSDESGPLVLLAAPLDAAPELAAATLGRPVTVTLRS